MRDDVAPRPGAHGGDGAALARMLGVEPDAVLDLSASLNPFAPDVASRVASAASSVGRYPDVEPARAALADAVGVDVERVVLTNGGAEAIALVAAVSPVGRVDEPEFSLYARHLRDQHPDAPRWRSNPHNPTGRLAEPGERAEVWDEAFYPLATGRWTRGDDGSFVVGSCTKVFACPGLRVGYVVAPDRERAEAVRAHQPQWAVSALACQVLPGLLTDADLPGWAAGIAGLRDDLISVLVRAGLEPDRSDASFVLVRDAPGVREHLARRTVLVRDTGSFGIAGGIRIAVPSAAGLDRVAGRAEGLAVLTDEVLDALSAAYDVVLLDVGDTLVAEAAPGTPTAHLVAEPMSGVLDTLHQLRGRVRLGAVTNTSVMREADVRSILDGAGVNALLDVVVTSTDVGVAKPDPRPVLVALDRMGVAPERALFVGDRASDRTAAVDAGAAFAATDRGLPDALARAAAALDGPCAVALSQVRAPDGAAMDAARARHDMLTKPAGSLGRLEDVGVLLAGIAGRCPPPVPSAPAVGLFAADHGVVASGVTPWSQAVTAQMVANFVAGGAAINVIAAHVGATVRIVDVGIAGEPLVANGAEASGRGAGTRRRSEPTRGVDDRRVRPGTADLAVGPAMTVGEARACLDAGAEVAAELVVEGHDLLVTGDMGIGNTTASAALIAVLAGRDAAAVTGRGTGIDDAMLARKTEIVDAAVTRAQRLLDPVSVLADVGGLEIGALAGFVLGAVAAQVPVVVDGVVALAALLVADALAPGVAASVIAGHRSTEPAATVALAHLGLVPLLDLGMRLGEGTGACLAVPVVQAAARVLSDMATFDEASVGDGNDV